MYHKQAFSLIEIMIASLLGIILIAGLMQIFLSIKKTYQLQQALAIIQENGRYVTYLLNQNIRMAGFDQCEDTEANAKEIIYGYSGNHLPTALKNSHVIPTSDVVAIKRCASNNGKEKMATILFYVAGNLRKNETGQATSGLYEKILFNNNENKTQELVSGLEDMRISFGISNDDRDVVAYKRIGQMQKDDWQKIKSLEIALLLNSINNVLSNAQIYNFDQQKIIANDKMLHKEWDTYITLRESTGQY